MNREQSKELFVKNALAAFANARDLQADASALFYGHCFDIIFDSLQEGGRTSPGAPERVDGGTCSHRNVFRRHQYCDSEDKGIEKTFCFQCGEILKVVYDD